MSDPEQFKRLATVSGCAGVASIAVAGLGGELCSARALTRCPSMGDAVAMSPRRVAANRLDGLRGDVDRLVAAILEGRGATSPQDRKAACAGRADDPAVARYVDVVRRQAYRVTGDDLQRLHEAGLDDDAIFELTVAAALGAAVQRLRVGLSLADGES